MLCSTGFELVLCACLLEFNTKPAEHAVVADVGVVISSGASPYLRRPSFEMFRSAT